MYHYLRRLEHIQITQQQAALVVLALYFVSAIFVFFIALMTHTPDNAFIIPGAISGSILFGGAWILYYKTSWEPIRYCTALASSLLVGLFLPEPFVTSYAPMVVVIPAVLALLLTEPFWVIVNSLLTLAILFMRAGGNGVYTQPTTLILYAMIVGALVVSRLIEETSLHRLKQAEEAILQSERQMSALVSSLDDIVFQFDDQGTYLNIWTSDENLLIRPRNEQLGKEIREVLGEELGRSLADAIRRVAASSQPEIIEYHLDLIGGRRWFRARINPVLDRDVHHQTVSMLIRDITDRKQAEQAHEESQKYFQALIEHAPDGIALLGKNGKLQQVTQSTEAILGYTLEEASKQDPAQLTHPEDLPSLMVLLNDLIQNPGRVARTEYRFRHKDGSWRMLESTISSMLHEPSLQCLIFNYRDITTRKQVEEMLRRSQETYRELFESNPHPMWVYDLDTLGFLMVNDAAVEHYGYTHDEFLGMTIKDIRPDEDTSMLLEHVTNDLHSFHSPLDWRHIKKDGRVIDVEVTSHAIQFAGRPARLVLANDITERKLAEEKLRNNEQRFRALIENGLDYISLLDAEGTLLWESPANVRMLEYEMDAFVGKDIFQLIHPEDLEMTRRDFAGLLDEPGGKRCAVFRLKHADGTWRWVEAVGSNFLENPSIGAIVLNYRDITSRKQAEDYIQYQANLLENVSDAIIACDMNSHITSWNPAAREIYGWQAEEVTGGILNDFLKTGYEPGVEKAQVLQQFLDNGIWRGEVTQTRKDGSEIAILSSVSLVRDESNTPLAMVAINRDITARKQAEAAILESEQKYRTLTENLKEVVYRADPITFRTIFVNQAVENIYGYSVEECLQDETLWESMIHPEDRQNVLQSFRSAQEQARDSSVEHRVIRKDGIQRWVIDRFSWEKSTSGRIVALSGVVSDITEQKQHEQELQSLNAELERHVAERTAELERANRTKDEFLANMSHELRTPLNSILGLSESLLEQRQGPLNDHQQKSLQIVEESGRHLLDLINDVLDLSKIEAGKFDFYPQSFSVDDVCRSSLAFIKAQAAKKSIRVTYSNHSSVVNIFADSRRLKQILVNLLTNAVKFTPDNGHVTLEVKTNLDQELIRFSVIDTGVGIAASDLQRLFQPFVQLDSSLNRQYQGTGLGLALVQKLADLHGGSVSVESEVGKGSCFTVNLACPRNIPARLEKPTQEQPGLGSRSMEEGMIRAGGSSPRPVILLAEDNMPNVLTIAEYLESYEYRVVVAHDGLEAIAKAEEVSPDLILMDIQMPAMNGLQAIAHLRTNPRFALTPIIALTALAMPGDRERCLAAGASDYLSKPVSLKLLRNSIETMLRVGKG